MYELLIADFAQAEGINENLKVSDQMKWVQKMNTIRCEAIEIILNELVCN